MIAALLFAAVSLQGNVRTVALSHGASIPFADATAGSFGYWDTSDTYLDNSAPDDNFGGEPILVGGPGKTILLRFGDLNRVLGSTRHIRKASLILTLTGGDKPTLKSVDRILVPWGAGPYFTVNALINRAVEKQAQQGAVIREKPTAPKASATWRKRLSGDNGASWQQAGANGPTDSESVRGAKATLTEKEVVIDGLETVIQYLADHPTDNYGLGVQFVESCDFSSSRSAIGKPRLKLELDPAPPTSGSDLSITSIERISASGGPPSEGEEVTYKAHVKNVGDAPAKNFGAVWTVNGTAYPETAVAESLAPGAETSFTTHTPYHADKTDHRLRTIVLHILPKGADATEANNALCVYENARQIDVRLPVGLTVGKNSLGTASVEDWVQEQVRIFNESYCAQSRFSFAPDGVKERVSVQHIFTGESAPADGAKADAIAEVPIGESRWMPGDPAFIKSITLAAGAPDFTLMNFPLGKRVKLEGGKALDRGNIDVYPGVVGYGDTRYEGSLAGPIGLLYEPYLARATGLLPLVPTGLLSETDVAVLNAHVDHSGDGLDMPKTTLLKVADIEGKPLSNVQLDFFQSQKGEIEVSKPTFTVTSSQVAGTALLPSPNGTGPFGKLTPNGDNGTFLIRATVGGVTEWGWLKAWQVIDTANRGNRMAGVIEVRFNVPSVPLDTAVDLARDRIITDSTNQLPAKLGPLVSGAADREVELGAKVGDWVEIDLGRDRTIGEIDLIGKAESFWSQFDVMVYSTGQKPSEASPWATELDWKWTAANRRDVMPGNDPSSVSVAYRAPETRIRFVRIVNRSGSAGKLQGIRVVPIKITNP
jgi:hypothetical protein